MKTTLVLAIICLAGITACKKNNVEIKNTTTTEKFSTVSAGLDFSFYIKPDKTLWATGYIGAGQLGDGTNDQIHSGKNC